MMIITRRFRFQPCNSIMYHRLVCCTLHDWRRVFGGGFANTILTCTWKAKGQGIKFIMDRIE